MRLPSPWVRANCPSPLLCRRRPALSAPPPLAAHTCHFTTTAPRPRFQLPTRKKQAIMPTDMTTLKGEPFDRAALESLVKACALETLLSPPAAY